MYSAFLQLNTKKRFAAVWRNFVAICVVAAFAGKGEIHAQFSITFQFEELAPQTTIYVAGSFNEWQTNNALFRSQPLTSDLQVITIGPLVAGTYQFKFTRGSWQTAETDSLCHDLPDRTITISSDTVVRIEKLWWKDIQCQHLQGEALFEFYLEQAFHYLPYNLDSSVAYAMKNYALPEARGHTKLAARALNIQGEIFVRLGNAQQAITIFEQALAIQQRFRDTGALAYLHYQLGNTHWQQGDTPRAVYHYHAVNRLSNPILTQHPLHDMYTDACTRLAMWFEVSNQSDSSNFYLQKAAGIGDRQSALLSLYLGDNAFKKGDTNLAKHCWKNAIDLATNLNPDPAIATQAMMNMANHYNTRQQRDSAMHWWMTAQQLALQTGNKTWFIASNGKITSHYALQGNSDSVMFWQQEAIRFLDDKVNSGKQLTSLGQMFEARLTALDEEAQKHTSRFRTAMLILIVLFILSAATWLWYKKRLHYQFEKQMKDIEIKALRAQMNPHFIFNCLNSINSLVVRQKQKEASDYLVRFSRLMRSILDHAVTDKVSLAAEINTLQLYLDMELLRFGDAFTYTISIADDLPASTIDIPSLIIQPFVENAIWHGLMPASHKGVVDIRVTTPQEGMLQVAIADNGIGREAASHLKKSHQHEHKSFGMQISRDRLALMDYFYELKGHVTVTDLYDNHGVAAGTNVILTIPYESNHN